MHIFGVIVWLGGLLFQSAVALPIARVEGSDALRLMRLIGKRFTAFVWMSVWTVGITGFIMMLLSPQFLWFQYGNSWSVLLGFKQLIFIVMVFYSFGYARMLSYLEKPASNGGFNESIELYRHRLNQFRKINIALGITAVLLAAGM